MPNHQMSQKRVKGRVHGANGNHEVVCYKDLKNIFKKMKSCRSKLSSEMQHKYLCHPL